MPGNIAARIRALEEMTPKGYTTFGVDGKPVIQSDLWAGDWYMWATNLLRTPGRNREKCKLWEQLLRSTGRDNGGGLLYELVMAMAEPLVRYVEKGR